MLTSNKPGTVIACYYIMGMIDKIRALKCRILKIDEPESKKGMLIDFPSKSAGLKSDGIKIPKDLGEIDYAIKRRYQRYSVEGSEVRAHMLFPEEVTFYNLSVNGACIRTEKELKVGCKYLIRVPDEKMPLYINCYAVWKSDNSGVESEQQGYLTGLRFLNISSSDVIRLKDFMRNSGVPKENMSTDQYKPSPLRFYITSNQKTVIKCPELLSVKTISLGGLLAVSNRALELEGRYFMRLILSSEADPIKCRFRVASIIPGPTSSKHRFDIGVEFIKMEDADRTRLDSFIHSLS